MRRISDPDVLQADFRCPACVYSHFFTPSFFPLIFRFVAILSAPTHRLRKCRLLAYNPFTDVCWAILERDAAGFAALEKVDSVLICEGYVF
jgi:hypothetical protein